MTNQIKSDGLHGCVVAGLEEAAEFMKQSESSYPHSALVNFFKGRTLRLKVRHARHHSPTDNYVPQIGTNVVMLLWGIIYNLCVHKIICFCLIKYEPLIHLLYNDIRPC